MENGAFAQFGANASFSIVFSNMRQNALNVSPKFPSLQPLYVTEQSGCVGTAKKS